MCRIFMIIFIMAKGEQNLADVEQQGFLSEAKSVGL